MMWFLPTIKMFKRRGNLAYRSKNFKNKDMSNLHTTMPYSEDGQRFFNKRYYLFSKFDGGIKLDEESKWLNSFWQVGTQSLQKRFRNTLHAESLMSLAMTKPQSWMPSAGVGATLFSSGKNQRRLSLSTLIKLKLIMRDIILEYILFKTKLSS